MGVTELVYRINANTTSLGRELRFAERDVRRFSRRAESQVRKFGKAFAAVSGAVVTGLGAMVKQQIDAAAEMDVMASTAGTTTEELSELEWVAQQTDVSFDVMQSRLQRMTREMADASQEADEGATKFGRWGIVLRDNEGAMRSNTDVLRDIANRVAEAGDEIEQTAIATEFFGNRGGQELLPLLQQGSKGIEELTDQAHRMGIVITDEAGAAAQQFQQDLREMRAQFRGVAIGVTAQALPALSDFTSALNTTSENADGASDSSSRLEDGLRHLFATVNMVGTGFQILAEVIGAAGATAVTVVNQIRDASRGVIDELRDLPQTLTRSGDEAAEALFQEIAEGGDGVVDNTSTVVDEIQAIWSGLGDETGDIWEDSAKRHLKIMGELVDGVEEMVEESDALNQELLDDDETDSVDSNFQQLETAAQRWEESTRTAFERHQQELAEVRRLYGMGLIDDEVFRRATDQIEEQLGDLRDTAREEAMDVLREQAFFAQDVLREIGQADAERMARLREQAEQVRAEIHGVDLAHQTHMESLRELREEGLITWEEYQMAVRQAKEGIEEVQEETSALFDLGRAGAQRLSDDIIGALVDPFNSSIEDMLTNFSQAMARMALEAAAQRAMMAAMGGGGLGFSGGGPVRSFSTGGFVSGPGTSTSDSIPARLSDGEYVQRAKAVRHYGTGFMEAINQMRVPKFASGGQVGAPRRVSQGGETGGGVTVVVALDERDIANAMSGSAGERVVLQHIQANPSKVGQ